KEQYLAIPTLAMIQSTEDQLEAKAQALLETIQTQIGLKAELSIRDVDEHVGGGSLPTEIFKGKAVSLSLDHHKLDDLHAALRLSNPPVICRIADQQLLFHVRTIAAEEYPIIAQQLKKVLVN
ncbi:MAG TPA: hypothetical protein DHN33_04620, partial [Eubacteriaceae bacterium]|nr:hypothetical protein [Eubacteriaceae bacterium]